MSGSLRDLKTLKTLPEGVSAVCGLHGSTLQIRFKTTAQSTNHLLLGVWLFVGFVLFCSIEFTTKAVFKAISPVLENLDITLDARGHLYLLCCFVCIFLLSIPFKFLSRLVRMRITISGSQLLVSGFPRRRFDMGAYHIIKIVNTRISAIETKVNVQRVDKLPEIKQLLIVEKNISEQDRIWINELLEEVMSVRDDNGEGQRSEGGKDAGQP
jgi:hypothetical protein